MLYTSFLVASLATTILSHGIITSPPVRAAGPAMIKACGDSVTALVTADPESHVEDMPEAAALEPNFDATACNLFLCKGLQFADNTANVQSFTPGQVVNFQATIPIPHKGPMNVSVIDTKTNTAMGAPLISFISYADESLAQLPANNTDFDVTIPTTLGSACAVAGDCVLQWFWFGTGAAQTYESCVDMTVAPAAVAGGVTSGATDIAAGGSTGVVAAPVKAALGCGSPRPRI